MKTQGEHIRTLRRRVDFLQARDHKNSYDQAELGALEWALVNLPPAQQPQRWAVFCQGCRKEWSVSYPHPGKDICVDCDDKPAQQEPVAWMCADESLINKGYARFSHVRMGDWKIPVYANLQQRPWQGLTDEEVTWLCNTAKSHEQTWGMFARAIEAKLKEKNNG